MSQDQFTALFLGLGLLLWTSKLLGELFKKLGQAAVVGELMSGLILGPTLLGMAAPGFFHWVFPLSGPVAHFYSGFNQFAVAMLLFLSGTEIRLESAWKDSRKALLVSLSGILIPFALGWGAAHWAPVRLGFEGTTSPMVFELFFATAMSISALPVIAKALMDLNLLQARFGAIVMASAMVDDLLGWMIFSVVSALAHSGSEGMSMAVIGKTLAMTTAFAVFALTIGRWAINHALRISQIWAKGRVLSLCVSVAFFACALTEWIGVHALFGAFMIGVAAGNSPALDRKTREVLHGLVSSVLAPIFFAGIGLKVNFFTSFDLVLTALVLGIACLGKIGGCGIAARASGMKLRESIALGFSMNARGAMEIVLGTIALESGLIGKNLFVALIATAILTSMITVPALKRLLDLDPVQEPADDQFEEHAPSPGLRSRRRSLVKVSTRSNGTKRVSSAGAR